jgi:transcriptional antiterminator RfaH
MGYWAVAMTKSSSEHLAQYHLGRQGFETYLPKYLSQVGKEKKVKVLFPRYIFVRIELQWSMINGTRGVTRLIMNESTPAAVPDKIIENLMKRQDSKGLICLPEKSRFTQGEKVRVVNKTMEGYIAIYDGMRPNERARVLLELLGQVVPVELDERDLAPVVISSG